MAESRYPNSSYAGPIGSRTNNGGRVFFLESGHGVGGSSRLASKSFNRLDDVANRTTRGNVAVSKAADGGKADLFLGMKDTGPNLFFREPLAVPRPKSKRVLPSIVSYTLTVIRRQPV